MFDFSKFKHLSEQELVNLTGRVPRLISLLIYFGSAEAYTRETKRLFKMRIDYAFDSLSKLKQMEFLSNLDSFFGLLQTNSSIEFDGSVVDSGLFYLDNTDKYHSVSNIASEVLAKLLVNNLNLEPVFSKVRYL